MPERGKEDKMWGWSRTNLRGGMPEKGEVDKMRGVAKKIGGGGGGYDGEG